MAKWKYEIQKCKIWIRRTYTHISNHRSSRCVCMCGCYECEPGERIVWCSSIQRWETNARKFIFMIVSCISHTELCHLPHHHIDWLWNKFITKEAHGYSTKFLAFFFFGSFLPLHPSCFSNVHVSFSVFVFIFWYHCDGMSYSELLAFSSVSSSMMFMVFVYAYRFCYCCSAWLSVSIAVKSLFLRLI